MKCGAFVLPTVNTSCAHQRVTFFWNRVFFFKNIHRHLVFPLHRNQYRETSNIQEFDREFSRLPCTLFAAVLAWLIVDVALVHLHKPAAFHFTFLLPSVLRGALLRGLISSLVFEQSRVQKRQRAKSNMVKKEKREKKKRTHAVLFSFSVTVLLDSTGYCAFSFCLHIWFGSFGVLLCHTKKEQQFGPFFRSDFLLKGVSFFSFPTTHNPLPFLSCCSAGASSSVHNLQLRCFAVVPVYSLVLFSDSFFLP